MSKEAIVSAYMEVIKSVVENEYKNKQHLFNPELCQRSIQTKTNKFSNSDEISKAIKGYFDKIENLATYKNELATIKKNDRDYEALVASLKQTHEECFLEALDDYLVIYIINKQEATASNIPAADLYDSDDDDLTIPTTPAKPKIAPEKFKELGTVIMARLNTVLAIFPASNSQQKEIEKIMREIAVLFDNLANNPNYDALKKQVNALKAIIGDNEQIIEALKTINHFSLFFDIRNDDRNLLIQPASQASMVASQVNTEATDTNNNNNNASSSSHQTMEELAELITAQKITIAQDMVTRFNGSLVANKASEKTTEVNIAPMTNSNLSQSINPPAPLSNSRGVFAWLRGTETPPSQDYYKQENTIKSFLTQPETKQKIEEFQVYELQKQAHLESIKDLQELKQFIQVPSEKMECEKNIIALQGEISFLNKKIKMYGLDLISAIKTSYDLCCDGKNNVKNKTKEDLMKKALGQYEQYVKLIAQLPMLQSNHIAQPRT